MQASQSILGGAPGDGFRFSLRVYFEDTDSGGVVYYANYLKFCERARSEWLRERGFGQHQLLEEAGIAFVVRSLTADFRQSARLDDQLDVFTRVEQLRGASIVFLQRIVRAGTDLFDARVTVACIDTARHRASPIPAEIRRRLGQTI